DTGAKSLSVKVGDSVTLYTDVPEIQKYDAIRFRDRLQLDQQTGSLTIIKTETNHSGRYEVEISSSKHTIHKTFNVTVSG
ncbi:hypothetical protein M9458_045244, partial [Cirrhinus mrigala]